MDSIILVVEDHEVLRSAFVRMLELAGYPALGVASGEEALGLVRNHPPRLVLLDVRLPGIDGGETLRRLKESSDTATIPVILTSAHSTSDGDLVSAYAEGAVSFLPKPFAREQLLGLVQTVTQTP